MEFREFEPWFNRLYRAFRPRAPQAELADDYFRQFQHWPDVKWEDAANKCYNAGKGFPSPRDLRLAVDENVDRARLAGKGDTLRQELPACTLSPKRCLFGRIWFEVQTQWAPHGDERHLACDCPSGTEYIAKTLSIAYPGVPTVRLRYSYRMRYCGGIDTALGGLGLVVESLAAQSVAPLVDIREDEQQPSGELHRVIVPNVDQSDLPF